MSGHETGAGPRVTFAVASAAGDIPFEQGLRDVPLEGCPLSTTYGEYFDGVRDFILGPGLPVLIGELAHRTERPCPKGNSRLSSSKPRNTARCIIRPASRPLARPKHHPRGQRGRKPPRLGRPGQGARGPGPPVPKRSRAGLPRPLCFHEGDRLDFLMVDWFSGFHEFHVGSDGRIVLWDYEEGGLTPLDVPTARRCIGSRRAS